MARFLSSEWITELDQALASTSAGEQRAEKPLLLQQEVTGTPRGDVTYHVLLGSDVRRAVEGGVEEADVTLRTRYATAVALARGEVTARDAIIAGLVKVAGNVGRLLERQALVASLDTALASVREGTTWD